MSDRAWWVTTLQWTLWGVLMAIVGAWLNRSRMRRRSASAERRMVHPVSTLLIGALCVAFFGGITIISNAVPNPTTTWWTTTFFVGFALMGAPLVFMFFIEAHEISEDGIAFRNFAGVRKHLRWTDLAAVRYAPVMKWFRLETKAGTVARVSVMLMGLPEFASLLLQHAPVTAIDPETYDVLRATAAGDPPSVMA
jgi:hypothetical protein